MTAAVVPAVAIVVSCAATERELVVANASPPTMATGMAIVRSSGEGMRMVTFVAVTQKMYLSASWTSRALSAPRIVPNATLPTVEFGRPKLARY